MWLSSPGPGFSYCAWFALVPLLLGCLRTTPGNAAKLGFACGLFYYTLLIYWVVISLGTYGNLPWWACGIALLALSSYMSLYLAFFCAAASWSMKKIIPVWYAPFLWIGLDSVRGFLFSGFPWQDLGYSQFKTPLLIQTADLAGHHGVTFLIVLTNCLFFIIIAAMDKRSPWSAKRVLIPSVSAFLLICLAATYSWKRYDAISSMTAESPRHRISVIQGNIDQNQKWKPDKKREAVEKYIRLSNKAARLNQSNLVIWPETAMPFNPTSDPLFAELLSQTVFSDNYALLSGAPYFLKNDKKTELYNSAILVEPDGTMSRYFKQHLVPFGEYIPFADYLPLPGPVVESVANFSSGTKATPLANGRSSLGVLICFESIFPNLARKEVASGANILVNITNDAWFGRSSASTQHMAMAVFRAVENRRSLARAANTGISCFIDPTGIIHQATPIFEPASINRDLAMLQQTSFFTQTGYLFPFCCLIYLIPLTIWIRLRPVRGH